MCQWVLDTEGESLVSFDRHSPESCRVFGVLMPTCSGQRGGHARPTAEAGQAVGQTRAPAEATAGLGQTNAPRAQWQNHPASAGLVVLNRP
jgi:hypothetical protein